MRRMKMVIMVGLVSAVTAAGCAMPQPDQVYCDDISKVQDAVQQYADVERVSVTNEVLEDLNEMGATERCPGYNPAEADKDG